MAEQVPPVEAAQRSVPASLRWPAKSIMTEKAAMLPSSSQERPTTLSLPSERLEMGGGIVETYAQFVLDENLRLKQVRIIDANTGRVVREIPPDALVELAAALRAYEDVRSGRKIGDDAEASSRATGSNV